MTRYRPPSVADQLDALFASPLIYDLAADLEDLNRRTRRHPLAMHLAYGSMARIYRSANRLDAELLSGDTWQRVVERYNAGSAAHPRGIEMRPATPALLADTYRHVRDQLTTEENLETLQLAFTTHSVALAQRIGLLVPTGGSRTRPHPQRTIYGDGTVVRPLYNRAERGRQDPDAEEHTRHDGQIYGNNLVAIAVRGEIAQQRVILAVGRVQQRGREADEAVRLIRQVHAVAGDAIQAVVYDGAFRGVHHEILMSEMGLIVVNKVHAGRRAGEERVHRQIPLGPSRHVVHGRTCEHTLIAQNGSVHEASFDDGGALVLSEALPRRQVRRYQRGGGGWRFSVGVVVPCPKGTYVTWISPHPQPGERGHGRPDQLRLLPESDPHFQRLYGLRNDSESINSGYKRTLIVDRAAARGWRRQVIDLLSWGIATNSVALHNRE